MSPVGEDTIIGNLPKQQTYKISYIFESGLLEFDQNVAFLNINSLESFLNLDNTRRNIEVYLKDPLKIDSAKFKFQDNFRNSFIYTWADLNRSLFSALKVREMLCLLYFH